MLKFPVHSDDTFLIIAPRWADLGTHWQMGLLALLLLVPLGLILWLCRYELRLVSRGQAAGLLTLRLLILVVLWLIVGLQPHMAGIHVEETPSRVRVALDLSTSMEVTDEQRLPAEKLRLARALKLDGATDRPTDTLLDEWVRQYESGRSEPDWLASNESFADRDDRERITQQRRRWHDQTLAAVDALSRQAVMARILSADGIRLLERLTERHQVEIVGFHQQSTALLPDQLFEKLSGGKSRQETVATDLRQPLSDIASGRDRPLLGIVLFSDGQHNVGTPPYDRAMELGRQRIPIYPVLIGSREPPRDLMILDVQAPAKVFKNATAPIEIRCKVTSLPAQELTVEMQFDGKPVRPEHRKVLQHQGKDDIYTVSFQAKMEEIGTHALSIKATSKDKKEITLANNRATRILRVAEDKAQVLLIDGEARWEYSYLANALARDPTIHLERVVFTQPRIDMIKDDFLEKAGLPRTKLPAVKTEKDAVDPLMNYDCILLGDVSPEQLPLADRRRLEKFVAERGGTLILLAGKRYMPLAFAATGNSNDDPLAKLLPITEPRIYAKEKGFTLHVTAEGKQRPFLQLQPDQPASPWPDLPKHYWGIVGKRKPAASVLLTPQPGLKELRAKDESDTGIFLQQNYGAGRVLFVGLDSTWRWRYRVGDAYHHRFWGQLARWAAADKLLPAGNSFVRYGPREPVYAAGQDVELAVRVSDGLPALKDVSPARAKLFRKRDDGTEELIAVVPLAVNPRQPNLLEATVRELAAGVYRMEPDIPAYREHLTTPDATKKKGAQQSDLFRILPPEHGEMLDLATNVSLMQSLAASSDGKLYTPLDVDQLPDRLARRIERKEHREESKPWQDEPMVWWLLGTLLSLLTLEWGWRKWLDLP